MPPIKIYETLQQSNPDMTREAGGERQNRDEFDFFKKEDDQSKKDGQSALGAGSLDKQGSPQKSLAIKGPPKIIAEKLEIANYQGVKVTDINVRPIQQSVAQLRAQKEMSSMHSNRNLDGSASHHNGSALNQQLSMSQGLHGQLSQGGGTDNASRVFSADNLDHHLGAPPQIKTIVTYLNDKITNFLMASKDPYLQKLKIEGDLVTSFFDSVGELNDATICQFFDEIKKDIEFIM